MLLRRLHIDPSPCSTARGEYEFQLPQPVQTSTPCPLAELVFRCRPATVAQLHRHSGSISRRARFAARLLAAIRVVPLPKKGSSTIAPRREQSFMASATRATGFTVGCMRSSSFRPRLKVLTSGYVQTFDRDLPWCPSSTLLTCVPVPFSHTRMNSCWLLYREPMPALVLHHTQMFLSS